jgi:hypothetical protein
MLDGTYTPTKTAPHPIKKHGMNELSVEESETEDDYTLFSDTL